MNIEQLRELVDRIIEIGEHEGDDETAHTMEDALHLKLLENFLPIYMMEEIDRLTSAHFNRWCA